MNTCLKPLRTREAVTASSFLAAENLAAKNKNVSQKSTQRPSEQLLFRKSPKRSVKTIPHSIACAVLFCLLSHAPVPWKSSSSLENTPSQNQELTQNLHLEKTTLAYDLAVDLTIDADGRCGKGMSAGWDNGNGPSAGSYDPSQASSTFSYGAGWMVGGVAGDFNAMLARPVAQLGVGILGVGLWGLNSAVEAAEEKLGGPGSLTASGFMFAPALEMLSEMGSLYAGAREVGLAVEPTATGKFYSAAFQTQLAPTSYPGVTRYMHFKEANVALDEAVKVNPALEELGISVPKSPAGSILGKSPENWTWHHDVEPGVMQLVPKNQHPNIPGGIFWETMHPEGDGGYSIWGK